MDFFWKIIFNLFRKFFDRFLEKLFNILVLWIMTNMVMTQK